MISPPKPDYKAFRILVDQPAGKAALGFDDYAEALADSIKNSHPQFAVGIFGGWGSGKTTLMKAIKARLTDPATIVVDFNAWRYEREEHLLIPLLDTIREAVFDWSEKQAVPGSPVKQAAKATARTLGKVITSFLAGVSLKVGLPNALEFSYEASKTLSAAAGDAGGSDLHTQVETRGDGNFPQSIYHLCFRKLEEAFGQFRAAFPPPSQMRIVIFVDDLDRCLPQPALDVLEAVKLFFEMEGFVFVIGLESTIVERFVESRYPVAVPAAPLVPLEGVPPVKVSFDAARTSLISGADYIKKIFQVPISLPPVRTAQLDELLTSMQEDAKLPYGQAQDLTARVSRHLRSAIGGAAVNPREVKRFINAYIVQMKIKNTLDPDVVLALLALKNRPDWKDLYDGLVEHRDEFVAALQPEEGSTVQQGLSALRPSLGNAPQSFFNYIQEADAGHIGGAGAALAALRPNEIDDYIYSGEAAVSRHGHSLLEALQHLIKARRPLALPSVKSADIDSGFASIAVATSTLSNMRTYASINALLQKLERLKESQSPPNQGGFYDTVQTLSELDLVIQQLREARRQDAL